MTVCNAIVMEKDTISHALLLEPAKINKIKSFSGLCYVLKLILELLLGAQELFLIGFIGQNKVKIFNKVKICQNRFSSKTSRKKNKKVDSFLIFLNFWASANIFLRS